MKDGRYTIDTMRARFCSFCRSESTANVQGDMKLAKAGHHKAMNRIGFFYFNGQKGLQQDKKAGMKWWRLAAEAGSSEAANNLGMCYRKDNGVEQDIDRALEYYRKEPRLGGVAGFVNIGALLMLQGSMEEAMLNLRKAAICGLSDKLIFNALRKGYRDGYITKEEYAFTLRENQKVNNEMKSESREKITQVLEL